MKNHNQTNQDWKKKESWNKELTKNENQGGVAPKQTSGKKYEPEKNLHEKKDNECTSECKR